MLTNICAEFNVPMVRKKNHRRYATAKMTPWKFFTGFFSTSMDVYCLFSPIDHIIITHLDKICLSCAVEILTDKWGNVDNVFILRCMQKKIDYRVSNFTKFSWKPCHIGCLWPKVLRGLQMQKGNSNKRKERENRTDRDMRMFQLVCILISL